jgi:hypothetical protein
VETYTPQSFDFSAHAHPLDNANCRFIDAPNAFVPRQPNQSSGPVEQSCGVPLT